MGIEFQETNLDEVLLECGSNEIEMGENAEALTDCEEINRNKMKCTIDTEDTVLVSYDDGEKVKCRFRVTDLAGNEAVTRAYYLDIDQTDPEIKYFEYTINKRMATFILDIEEENFKQVYYIDDDDERETKKRLCNKLKDGRCYTKKRFNPGDYSLTIYVEDKAGNIAEDYAEISTY